ncbi:unnamed protein product [Staurois parvus]|uniref:Uncharacterized protein n=1 Tax=Staurois parvus TaxID=386267 RepID=A0ABN9AEK8_9NEOB|nr:unnamed protein product [Staurois parvus]
MVLGTETPLRYQSPGGSTHPMQIRPHFPGPRCVAQDDMPPLSSGHIPRITQQLCLLVSDWPPEL